MRPRARTSRFLGDDVAATRRESWLRQCAAGHDKVAADAELVAKVGVSGTPTLIADGKLISGFQQAELEAFLDRHAKPALAKAVTDAPR